jgi:hypothetical protein
LARAARANVDRAQDALAHGDLDAATIWGENALVNAADAVLQRDGVRVRGTDGAHQARFGYARLPRTFTVYARVIARARRQRNVAAYEGGGRISRKEAQAIVLLCIRVMAEVEVIFK